MPHDSRFDTVRAVCNFLVVVLHAWASFQYCDWSGAEYWFWKSVNIVSGILLPTLFVLSGYLASAGLTRQSFAKKLKGRCRRIAIPYVVWNVCYAMIYLVLCAVVPRLATRVNQFALNTPIGFVSKTIGPLTAPIDGPLWYMRACFVYFLLLPFALPLLRVAKGFVFCGALIAWSYVMQETSVYQYLNPGYPLFSVWSFFIGAWLAQRKLSPIDVFRGKWWLICPIVGLFIQIGLEAGWFRGGRYLWTIAALLLIPGLWTMASGLEKTIGRTRLVKIFLDYGYFIYAGHFLFCSMLMHLSASFLFGHWAGKFTVLVLIFMMGLPIMFVVCRILERWTPRFFAVINGRL